MRKAVVNKVTKLLSNPPANVTATLPDPNDMTVINLAILGPQGTPYEGGVFNVTMTLSADKFPHVPPELKFTTKIYHPNVEQATGKPCVPLVQDQWKPTVLLPEVAQAIIDLLVHPNPDHSVEMDVGQQYATDLPAFNRTAQQWTKQYATPA